MRSRHLLFPVLAMLLLPGALRAQDDDQDAGKDHPRARRSCECGLREVSDRTGRSRRQGFWLSLGLGVGSESFDANDGLGWSDGKSGGVGFIRLGGTVSPSLLLGVEASGWAATYQQGYDRRLGSLMGVAQWYPSRDGDFWLRGGLGFARAEYDPFDPLSPRQEENGTALSVGLGYDFPVGRKVSVTPLLDLTAQRYETHDERVLSFGVGVTFH